MLNLLRGTANRISYLRSPSVPTGYVLASQNLAGVKILTVDVIRSALIRRYSNICRAFVIKLAFRRDSKGYGASSLDAAASARTLARAGSLPRARHALATPQSTLSEPTGPRVHGPLLGVAALVPVTPSPRPRVPCRSRRATPACPRPAARVAAPSPSRLPVATPRRPVCSKSRPSCPSRPRHAPEYPVGADGLLLRVHGPLLGRALVPVTPCPVSISFY